MSTTITIRVDTALKEALQRQAEAEDMSLSRYVRRLLEQGVAPSALRDRTGHLRGGLRLPADRTDSWTATIRERNWRA